jgi:hypothetical protein
MKQSKWKDCVILINNYIQFGNLIHILYLIKLNKEKIKIKDYLPKNN